MKIVIATIVFFSICMGGIMAQEIRPVRDDVGFCWTSGEMDNLITYLGSLKENGKDSETEGLIGGISPHDDYLYAGNVYYPLFKSLKTKEVVIFGVTHGTVRREIGDPQGVLLLDEFKFWQGPYNRVSISPLREVIKSKLNPEYFKVDNKAHTLEHSIEALVPFIQHFNPDVKITPVMVTAMPYESMDKISGELAGIIADYMKENGLKPGKDIAFLISSDANHYGKDFNNAPYGEDENAHRTGTERDRSIAKEYLNGPINKAGIEKLNDVFTSGPDPQKIIPLWCGRYSIPFGMLTLYKTLEKLNMGLSGKYLRSSDSWTEGVMPVKRNSLGLTAPFSLKHWVGYVSAGFYLQ